MARSLRSTPPNAARPSASYLGDSPATSRSRRDTLLHSMAAKLAAVAASFAAFSCALNASSQMVKPKIRNMAPTAESDDPKHKTMTKTKSHVCHFTAASFLSE
jgi:hypothetical protein